MYPIAITKIFEDFKRGEFNERYEAFKLIYTWLKNSPCNLPLIFCQGIAAIAKTEDAFKKGCIEFLRELAIIKTDYCSTVDGFRTLINCLLEENCLDLNNNILITLLYVINDPNKRKQFNGFSDFYKIFSIFTKSDYTLNEKHNENNTNSEEKSKLDIKLELSKTIIQKLLKTWPGFSLIMGDYMAFGSLVSSLNSYTNISIKKSILSLISNILENEASFFDNFSVLTSTTNDTFYINKIYLAYILQAFKENKLYENIIEFIEDENNPLNELAQKLALKLTILYSKLSNEDLQFPYLKDNINKESESKILESSNKNIILNINSFKKKSKIMNLLDETFYHFNCNDISCFDISSLPTQIINSMNTMINMQKLKVYSNQYSIEASKKELFSISEDTFQQILKNSKILDTKEYYNWNWKLIEEILDIVEIKKELIMELYKQKFFRRLLFCFMPSKSQFVKESWSEEYYIYSKVGTKFFKLLSQVGEGISILDASPEESFFQKTDTWFQDVYNCFKSLLSNSNLKDDKSFPFSIYRVYQSMAKQIFVFLGILTQTLQGDNYLASQKFYELINEFINTNNDNIYDYVLTNLIDNINYDSKYFKKFVELVLEKGSNNIKRYILEHLLYLLSFGKNVIWDINILMKALCEDDDINIMICNILKMLVLQEQFIEELADPNKDYIQKLSSMNKEILYLMLRSREHFRLMENFIENELKNINIKKIVEDYSKKLECNIKEIFNLEEKQSNSYITINLPFSEYQNNICKEIIWLKQLPFNANIGISENNSSTYNDNILNSYIHYKDSKNLILYAKPMYTNIISINSKTQKMRVTLLLANSYLDSKCKLSNIISYTYFNKFDKYNLENTNKRINNKEVYVLKKGGISIYLLANNYISGQVLPNEFILDSIIFNIRIKNSKNKGLNMPINILTELANNEKGIEKLKKIKAIEYLFKYIDINKKEEEYSNPKHIKSAMWILGKIITKETFGNIIEQEYNILNKLLQYKDNCDDYSMKGTLYYILSYISQNSAYKSIIEETFFYFFNTNICFPKNINELFMCNKSCYENIKLKNSCEKVIQNIYLTDYENELYKTIVGLINPLSQKLCFDKLSSLFKEHPEYFCSSNLFALVYMILQRYKCKNALRRSVMNFFEISIFNEDISVQCKKIIDDIDLNILQ